MTSIIERLKAASGPDRELDCLIFCETAESPFTSYYPDCVLAQLGGFAARVEIDEIVPYTASVDNAVALVDRMLPGACWRVEKCHVHLGNKTDPFWASAGMAGEQEAAYATTAPIAILLALFTALAANDAVLS